jgi:D-erythronate 2-dehydrogenase
MICVMATLPIPERSIYGYQTTLQMLLLAQMPNTGRRSFPMHILIIGAAGMVGRKLAARLAADGQLGGQAIVAMTLADAVTPSAPAGFSGKVTLETIDLSEPGAADRLTKARPDVIFHLAAIVSGEAELDFDKGYRINLDGTRYLFDAIRLANDQADYKPRVVFTSSIAVFGAPLPYPIPDEFHTTPLTSYGTQKAICELLLSDYSRRGFLDGIGIRLPTICIRPGVPNKAASGFFSNILREPLAGKEAVLPVSEDVRHWHASPRSAVGFLIHGATIDLDTVGPRRNLSMPGLSATVGEQIEALRRIAGEKAVKLIRREPDAMIMKMVSGWAPGFEAKRASALGFSAETSFDEIIRVHIEDEMQGAL